jgi:hypothetical protein
MPTFGSVTFEVALGAGDWLSPEVTLGQAQTSEQVVWDAGAATFTAIVQVRPAGLDELQCGADLALGDYATLAGQQDGTARTLEDYPLASGTADLAGMLLASVGPPSTYADGGGALRATCALRFVRPKA